ncbi:MAG: hypothetical protein MUO27_09250 [Sedimentisphaerales bacterium]|nr:hypothetical protein [Sedimentisphaerales bacterium]
MVVDKSVFHTLHHCDEKLCAFVKNYNVVLPYALAVECAISEKEQGKDPEKLLRGLVKAIKAGAKMGHQSSELLNAERMTLCPVKSVVDEVTTQQLRDSTLEISKDSIKQAANHCLKVTQQKINEVLVIAKTLYQNICKNRDFKNNFSKSTPIEERFKNWIRIVDSNNIMDNTIETRFGKQISSRANANWYTWQFARLWFAYCWDWSHKKSLPGSCVKKDISNDFYDIEPVLYLSRSDGLLTNDQKLQVPLAKAAFPEKDLFVVDTCVNDSRKEQDVFDDIVSKIPAYRIE